MRDEAHRPSETCPQEPPPHPRWHVVSSTCRAQHASTNDTSIHLTLANSSSSASHETAVLHTVFAELPTTQLQRECVLSLNILPLEKWAVFLASHVLSWRWIQTTQLKYLSKVWTNFCCYRHYWKQRLGNQKTQSYRPTLPFTYCVLEEGWISPLWSCALACHIHIIPCVLSRVDQMRSMGGNSYEVQHDS